MQNDTIVIRGGLVKPERLKDAVTEHLDVPGLTGFSVQAEEGCTVEDLAIAGELRNRYIGISTLEKLIEAGRNLGYEVKIIKSPGLGYHATVQTPKPLPDDLAQALSSAFELVINPAPYQNPK